MVFVLGVRGCIMFGMKEKDVNRKRIVPPIEPLASLRWVITGLSARNIHFYGICCKTYSLLVKNINEANIEC